VRRKRAADDQEEKQTTFSATFRVLNPGETLEITGEGNDSRNFTIDVELTNESYKETASRENYFAFKILCLTKFFSIC